MVSLMQEMTDERLAEITRREIAAYAGNAHAARLFPILDDSNRTYAVVIIENDPSSRPAWVVIMARVSGDKIIIEEDTSLDKPLVDALVTNGGVPRELIVLAYEGESF